MMQDRRLFVSEGTWIFTATLKPRAGVSLIEQVRPLRVAYQRTYQAMPFVCHAMVVLPDHLHAVWSLPPGDLDTKRRWASLKSRFTRGMRLNALPLGRVEKNLASPWEPGVTARALASPAELAEAMRYCWQDPVRHGLVNRATDWAYSSVHRDIKQGKLSPERISSAAPAPLALVAG